jgi:ferredoxin
LTRLKVVIDRSSCCGYGICAEICPDVFRLDDNGIVYVVDALVPEGLEEQAREGAEACPQSALGVEPA